MNSTKKSRAAGSLRSFAFVCVSVAALIVAACEGGSVTGPGETPVPTPELPNGPVLTINAFVCSASPKQLSVICEPAPDPMSPLPSYSQGIEWGNTAEPSKILIGGQHKNVDVTSTNIAIVADSFTFDVTVKNLRPQPIGTVDGITTDSSLAVFFHSGPTTTGGTGSVAVANPDGTGAFTAAGQPFFKYPQMLAQNQTSTAKKWKLRFDPGVNTFSFLLLISANVKHPDGYIDVFSSADSVAIGATLQMEDSVRDALGVATADQSETWQLSDSSKASIDAAGLLTGLAAGNVTVTATQGDKTGSKLITVKQPASAPDAKNDAFTAQVAVNLNGDVTVDNGSGADNLGAPAATLASFGGGSLGGTVTSNAAGQSVSLAGGTLTVNANGTLSLTSPTTGGVYTFQYRLTNSQGSDDATVTISVNRAPDAVDDALTADVAVTLNANLVLNDDRGAPAATVASFGGGSPGGTVTTNAAGASVALAGGTLTVNADGSVSLANATTSGTYTFQYRLTNPVGSDDATATIVVRRPPDAKNDAFTTTSPATLNGNVTSDNGSGADDLGDPAATVTGFGGGSLSGNTTTNAAGASVALAGGTLTVNANGTVSLANPAMGGVYTFRYRLANTAGSDSATVTINVNAAPIAVVDSAASNSAPGSNWHTAFNTTLSSPSVTANDNLGIPQATVATFGGGTLGGTVTSNAAGATVAVDGHSFTLNANGSFTYTPKTGFTGYFTTNYRITNAGGSSDALIKIAVGVRPSASNSTYGTTLPGNVGINTSTSTSTKVSAAGDGLTYNNVSATNGTGSVHADGTYDFKPSAGFASGNGTLVFTVTNGFGTTSNATVTIPVGAGRIWFVASGGTGDGRYGTPFGCIVGASGCLSNQSLNSNDIVHVGSGTYWNTANLNLTAGMRIIGAGATGAFSAASNANVTWPADAGAQPTTGAARPRIDTQSSIGVFVLATGNYLRGLIAGSSPGGSSISGSAVGTFTMSDAAIVNPGGGAISLTTSGTLAVTVDSIVASGTTGINLVNQGGTFTSALTKISGSTSTGINVTGSAGFSFGTTFVKKTSAGTAINLATNTGTTSFSSLVDSTTSGAALVTSSAGTVNIGGGLLHAVGGAAIDATSTTFSGAGFVSTTSSGSTGRGISLTNVSGTLALGSGSIGTAAAEDFFVSGGAATISYGGNITNTASRSVSISGITGGSITLSGNITDTGTGALIQNNTGGTISFSGATKVFNTGTNTAIALSTNTGATVSLVDSVKVTTTSGAGISASGGGILTITGSHNAISTTTGKALSVVSTTIGGLGLTFRSISANGAANGIELNTTGSGGLTVTGGSGLCGYVRATDVENTSGCDGGTITATTGSGISLTSASNVSLTRMRVTSAGGHGLFGQTVANLIVANSVFSGNGNETAGDGEGGIQLYDLSGTSSVTNTLVENSAAGNMFVSNSASTPLTLSATGNKFELANLNDGLAILGFNSASITGTVNNNKFVANKGDHFQAAPANSTTMTLTISGNRMEGSHPTVLGGGVTLRGGGTYVGTFTYDFVGDTVFDSKVTAITTGLGSSAPPGKILGKIRNSLFGRDGVTNSGSLQGSCLEGDIDTGTGTVTLLVDNNKFFRCFDRGMQFFGAKGGNGILNVTAKNNTVSQLLDVNSRHAIHAETGSSLNVETATTCYDFSSNNLTGQASNGDIRIRQRSFAPIGFPGYAGGAADDAAVANYLIARNTLNSATKVTASHTISNAYSNAGASCPTPP